MWSDSPRQNITLFFDHPQGTRKTMHVQSQPCSSTPVTLLIPPLLQHYAQTASPTAPPIAPRSPTQAAEATGRAPVPKGISDGDLWLVGLIASLGLTVALFVAGQVRVRVRVRVRVGVLFIP